MGILANILGADNPVAKWTLQNQNLLSNWGAGLGAGRTFGEGLGMAAQMGPQGIAADQQVARDEAEKAERQAAINQSAKDLAKFPDLMQAVASKAITPQAAYGEAWKRMSPDYNGGGGTPEFGLTPIWGQFDDGSFGYGVQGKDGSFKQVDTGALKPLDPRSLSTERAVGTAVGQGQGKAIVSAPAQLTNAGMAKGLIEEIRNHPELPWATGRSAAFGMNDARINPQRAAFQDLVEQAKGGAFLTAIQQLQGLGALSNAEGAAATAAINRINTAVEKDDFLKALEDYEALVNKGMEKAQAILQSQGLNDMGLPGAPSGGGVIDLGNGVTMREIP
jgi:hypothetical protein